MGKNPLPTNSNICSQQPTRSPPPGITRKSSWKIHRSDHPRERSKGSAGRDSGLDETLLHEAHGVLGDFRRDLGQVEARWRGLWPHGTAVGRGTRSVRSEAFWAKSVGDPQQDGATKSDLRQMVRWSINGCSESLYRTCFTTCDMGCSWECWDVQAYLSS